MRSTPARGPLACLLGAVAAATLIPVAATPASAEVRPTDDSGRGTLNGTTTVTEGPLTDLSPAADPTDGGDARLVIVRSAKGTKARLTLSGLGPHGDHPLGAHVHTGPCVAGDGAAAGPHYNHDRASGREPVRVSAETEIWLDVAADEHHRGRSAASVAFTLPAPADGAASLVVHEHPTDPAGQAGGRLACLPLAGR